MPFYETNFETGSSSVAFYEDDEEALRAAKAHHERATKGEPGGPSGAPAERIVTLRVYDRHPDDYNVDQTLTADELNAQLKDMVKAVTNADGVVYVPQLERAVRHMTHPFVNKRESAHDSMYKMEEQRVLTLEGSDK